MPKQPNTFADIPPITDFESCQKARPLILQHLGAILGVWQACENPACVRAKSCQRGDAACLTAFMQALPDGERRTFRYALENRRGGLHPAEALSRAQARVAGEVARREE